MIHAEYLVSNKVYIGYLDIIIKIWFTYCLRFHVAYKCSASLVHQGEGESVK